MNQNYDDIINLPHFVSKKHPQMPIKDRAAQFAPFAALTGHEAAIAETSRLTASRIELDVDAKTELDMKLQYLREYISMQPEILVTYFKPDSRKAGGSYLSVTGYLKDVNELERVIQFTNGISIPADDVISIESDIFADKF